MRTVYVITDAPRRPWRRRARALASAVVAAVLLALAVLGTALVLLIGALDALIAAALGTRRLAYICRLLRQAIRPDRKEDFRD
ncbi:hypothetical protein HS048_03785 [Planomonospora sp. ID91781]|uniref:hypothetical protein n=1 Tax=Planomonospora sp. ID91781 TaxID=2738135 RepID=UPI0018C44763|nr:hypothetical protein [Planomonospora sp. ID91781]MBG0819867.1 hypothetical protein [Planomonospora sp. ID91781]